MTIVALIALSWVLLAAALSSWLAEGRWRRRPHHEIRQRHHSTIT